MKKLGDSGKTAELFPSYLTGRSLGVKFVNLLPELAKGNNTKRTRHHLTAWQLERLFYTIEEFVPLRRT